MPDRLALTAAFENADAEWQVELEAQFGRQAGDARHELRGRGDPSTALHAKYLARDAAFRAWSERS